MRLSRPARLLAGLLGLTLALWSTGRVQAMSLRELRTLEASTEQGPLYADYYLIGVLEGLLEASEVAARAGRPRAFCPRAAVDAPRMARALLNAELTRHAHAYEVDMPVELVMSQALASTYRCAD